MNIILISDDRLKVILTGGDLDGYGIRVEDMDYDNTETKRVFWTILDRAKNETGFDAAISRIFIQIYPDTNGGCEMYVTRIGDKKSASRRADRVTCAVESYARDSAVERVYRFERTEQLVAACRALKANGFSGYASAYAESTQSDGRCYLIVRLEVGEKAKRLLCLSEYGEICEDKYVKWRIGEHCALIRAENAVRVLGDL